MNILHYTILLLGCMMSAGCGETFTLAPSSRIPKWFPSAEGVPRDNVSVTLIYYADNKPKATLKQKTGTNISVVTGTSRWHPYTLTKTNSHGGFSPDSYPHYVIVTMNGITEVIEHRAMESTFYISDDLALIEGLRHESVDSTADVAVTHTQEAQQSVPGCPPQGVGSPEP